MKNIFKNLNYEDRSRTRSYDLSLTPVAGIYFTPPNLLLSSQPVVLDVTLIVILSHISLPYYYLENLLLI